MTVPRWIVYVSSELQELSKAIGIGYALIFASFLHLL
jgi:hypothetical protein